MCVYCISSKGVELIKYLMIIFTTQKIKLAFEKGVCDISTLKTDPLRTDGIGV